MKDFLQRIEKLSPKQLVLLALDQKARIDKLERARREPIAVVGIGCRLPGDVHGPDSFWDLLSSGRDGISEVPSERFDVDAWYDPDPSAAGKIATRWGGFVRDVDQFDAAFFGISRREAISMDPQQRILLETSWEALEHSGTAPASLSGSNVGVFFGLSTADYYQLLMQTGHAAIDGYTATGAAHSIAAGRLAYLLGIHGPNLVVDTACSSSLVALHLACQSLRAGECEMALAGGANLILLPETTIALSKARMLAPDGRCKTFDESADGFVRSEGCGVAVLKTLSRALNDRDNILAVVRGSAVNQDGRSSGLTAPNGLAQEKVIREAMESAGVQPSEVQYVEAHGTGTSLGDPIEAHALAGVFGAGRAPQNPLYVGSAKSNVGHLEAAAGIAGFIKAVLSLHHESLPGTLHFRRMNPHIDLKGAPISVVAENMPWPAGRHIAGVSSFGFSGTNAHIILEQAPVRVRSEKTADLPFTLVLSARTKTALSKMARRYADYLAARPNVSLGDFCHTAAEGRNRFEHTVVLSAPSVEQMRHKLSRITEGDVESDSKNTLVKTTGDKIAIPVYPFERQRYWVETRQAEPVQERGEIGFCQLEWEPQSATLQEQTAQASAGVSAEALNSIRKKVESSFGSLSREHGLDRYSELQPELDRASFEYVFQALRQCGWKPEIGEIVRAEDLATRLGIRTRYVRSLGRMLEILGEDGALERVGQSWKVVSAPSTSNIDADFPLLYAAYPQFAGEITFLKKCGEKLADVLQGNLDPLNLLFPDGSFDTAETLYEKSAAAKVFQTFIQQAVAQVLERLPSDRRVRILEVGGGTGGTASYVARVLPPERVEYTFTDVSPLFAERGASKFRQYPFFRFDVLDLERDPETQGFANKKFDIIIAANCVHATVDLRATLRNIIKLLSPEGVFALLEGTRSERWVDISFGLTDGWWRFTDLDLRTDYPLISTEQWRNLLSEIGFRDTVVLPQDPNSQQVLLMSHGAAAADRQPWLVIGDSGRVGKLVSDRLTESGTASVLVSASDALPSRDGGWRGIIDLAALDVPRAEDLSDSQWAKVEHFGCERMLTLTRILTGRGGKLWVVTRGAQRVGGEVMSSSIAAAPLWGFGRSIALEQPDIWGGLIDVDASDSPETQAKLIVQEVIASDGCEDQIAFRRGQRNVARLKSRARSTNRDIQFNRDASYLITGGLGGLGLLVARWMASQGARRLILSGRSGVTREAQENVLREIESLGASVRIAKADVSDPQQMENLFQTIAGSEPPLRGVIHAAAALSRDSVRDMSVEKLSEVLRPKVLGTWLLHRHTRDIKLDFFCLFGSTASLLGSGGLGHYAAANQFLDAFAQYRRSVGLPALSIEWGTWDEMRTVSEQDRMQYRAVGLLPMASSDALSVLGTLLQSDETTMMAAAVKWRTLRAVFEARRKRPMLEAIEQQQTGKQQMQTHSATTTQWAELPITERENRLTQLVWSETCRVLQIEGNPPVEPDRGFFEMGMDSLVSVELKSRLETHLGRTLPAMLTFNFPNVRALSTRLAADFNAEPTSTSGNGTKVEARTIDTGALDDDEVARLLTKKLSRIQSLVGEPSSR